jgi:hypothetical protein
MQKLTTVSKQNQYCLFCLQPGHKLFGKWSYCTACFWRELTEHMYVHDFYCTHQWVQGVQHEIEFLVYDIGRDF